MTHRMCLKFRHKTAAVQQALATFSAQLLYLPPYLPDYNPIEITSVNSSEVNNWITHWGQCAQFIRKTLYGLGVLSTKKVWLVDNREQVVGAPSALRNSRCNWDTRRFNATTNHPLAYERVLSATIRPRSQAFGLRSGGA